MSSQSALKVSNHALRSLLGAWVDPFEHVEVLSLRHSAISSAVQPSPSFAFKSIHFKANECKVFSHSSFPYRAARKSMSAFSIASSLAVTELLNFAWLWRNIAYWKGVDPAPSLASKSAPRSINSLATCGRFSIAA